MKELALHRFEAAGRAILVIVCAGFVAADLFIVCSRITYPYQLEWMEGASLVQVSRLLAGHSLYGPPSIEYVPLIYPPLYFYVAAALARAAGVGFAALRLVSCLSSAGCAALLFAAVREKTGSRFAGLLAVGCFASTFVLTGQWFDIARTDMLAAALSMLGIYLARDRADGYTGLLLAGAALACAFLSKQSALIVCIEAVCYFLIVDRRRAVALGLTMAASLAAVYGIFWLNSAGWINYYLFAIPAAHAFDLSFGRILSVLVGQLRPVAVFLLAGLLPLILTPGEWLRDRSYRYYACMAAGLIATGVAGRLNAFSGPNVYVPTYLGVALLLGLEAGWLSDPARRANFRTGLVLLQWALVGAQFLVLVPAYLQTKTIPTAQDRAAGDMLVARIRSYAGDVLLLDNNYLALYAGKTPYFNEMPMSEISGQGNLHSMPQWPALQKQIAALLHAPTTDAAIVDFALPIQPMIAGCRQQAIPYADKIVFEPVAGPPNSRPSLIITCR